jgi:peptide/nickel transport system ATP-binding protein
VSAPSPDAVAVVRGLTVDYRRDGRWETVIRGLDLAIGRGEVVGLAGESGCGKSTLAALLLGERRSERRLAAGTVEFDGENLFEIPAPRLRALRRGRVALVPQNGGTSLTPTMRIARLFHETLRGQANIRSRADADREAKLHLGLVGIPDPAAAIRRYPHQFSGGQQQRIALALALCRNPDLLILDEPTTGQDALTRRGIVALLASLRERTRTAMLYVTHDLATLSEICDRIAVMYAGEIVELGPTGTVLTAPRHPYTRALVASLPRLEHAPDPAAILRGVLNRRLLPEGCRFAPRCGFAEPACHGERQTLAAIDADHAVACRRHGEALGTPERESTGQERVSA